MRQGSVRELSGATSILPRILSGSLQVERGGGTGVVTRFLCGCFGCERFAERLFLAGLLPLFKVYLRADETGRWLEHAILPAVAEDEVGRAGRFAVRVRLTEALFVEVLRRKMDVLPHERTSWLAAAGRGHRQRFSLPAPRSGETMDAARVGASSRNLAHGPRRALQPSLGRIAIYLSRALAHATGGADAGDRRSQGFMGCLRRRPRIGGGLQSHAFKREFGLPLAQYGRRLSRLQSQPPSERMGVTAL
jgi:hypothetical protein